MQNEIASVTIRVTPTIRDRLKGLAKRLKGRRKESASDVIERLLDKKEGKK